MIENSYMPDKEEWESHLDVSMILHSLEINHYPIQNIADFGCGYGTFSLAIVEEMNNAEVMAIDFCIENIKVHHQRIIPLMGDITKINGSGLPDNSMDFVILFHVLHHQDPIIIIQEALRVLQKGGRVGILHWRNDQTTPRDPPDRPNQQDYNDWAHHFHNSIKVLKEPFIIGKYHFGCLWEKI